MLATGRARWDTLEGPPLAEGQPRPGRIAWAVQEDGSQRAMLELDPTTDDPDRAPGQAPIAVGLPEPWYVDPTAGLAGPVETGLSALLAGRLLAAPPVPLALAPKVAAELTRRAKAPSLPVPADLPKPETLRGAVQPHLRLMLAPLPFDLTAHHRGFAFLPDLPREVPVARLAFGYGPVTVAACDRNSGPIVVREGRPYRVQRDTAGEREAVERLEEIGFLPPAMSRSGCSAMPARRPSRGGATTSCWAPNRTRPTGSTSCSTISRTCALRAGRWRSPPTSHSALSSRRAASPGGSRKARASTGSSCISG